MMMTCQLRIIKMVRSQYSKIIAQLVSQKVYETSSISMIHDI